MNDRDIEDTRQPKDEPEAEYCEFCGQETVECDPMEFYCPNPFCPEKFDKYKGGTISVVLDMSNHLVEVEQELADTKNDLKYANARITNLKTRLDRLTQSQSNVVVRDTEYAIKMVEDSIEYAYLDCGMNAEGRNTIWVNWAEVKKILASYG